MSLAYYSPPGACISMPNVLKFWDASRIAVAKTCWRKHWLLNVRGLRRRGGSSVHLEWGKAYHACVELYDNLVTVWHASPENAGLGALALATMESWDHARGQPKWGEFFTLFRCTDPATRAHKKDASKQVARPASERCPWSREWFEEIPLAGHPDRATNMICAACGAKVESSQRWLPEHKKKTRANLIRAVAAYCDTPGLEPWRFEDGSANTEVQHRLPLPLLTSPDGDPYQIVANMDSIVDHNGWAAIRERKTTGMPALDARFWAPYEMNPQVDTYDLVGRAVYPDEARPPKLLIEATRVTQGGEVEIQRQVVPISEGRAQEYLGEVIELVNEAEKRTRGAAIGLPPERMFPRNTTACHGKFGTCAFWRVCTAEPKIREQILAEDYVVEHWDPLTASVQESEEE